MRFSNKLLICLCCGLVATCYGMRDPTQPPIQKLGKLTQKHDSKLKVTQIIHSKKRKLVVINGKTLTVGDTIDKSRIVKIGSHSVYLMKDKSVVEVPIFSKSTKITQRK